MSSIGTVTKEIIIPHRKGNRRLDPEFVVLDDAHIQGILPGTDYQRMYICEYTRMSFGIKNAPAHFQRMMDTIFQEEILEGWMVVYIDDIII
ncbi:hypothetical protein O181_027476 [Austropuccinia psidii MF-1]|uniref:Reverse transcriptase domain-containing protein n=1 Tax=Austropuccinia psidii MF-1 TaxID=1389203 RepID=A0A9Q3CSJ9_9BASI|nr:hypothetical protein [Austropuccinia psidii MF-1]